MRHVRCMPQYLANNVHKLRFHVVVAVLAEALTLSVTSARFLTLISLPQIYKHQGHAGIRFEASDVQVTCGSI